VEEGWMKTLGAVLISMGLVVGGLLLLAVLMRMADLGRRDRRRPRRDGSSVAVGETCKPGRGGRFRGVRRGVGQAVQARPGRSPPGGTPLPTRVDFIDMTPIIIVPSTRLGVFR
jgi:hypothetical protein